jgi:hypothetical protein
MPRPWVSLHFGVFAINRSGIPHLAKNERDMGHPKFVAGEGPECLGLGFRFTTEIFATNRSGIPHLAKNARYGAPKFVAGEGS